MNGTYIPVVKGNTEELLFSPEQYDEIRTKMQGLSYYNTGKFVIDETAYVAEAKTKESNCLLLLIQMYQLVSWKLLKIGML